jgi:hypothetical protein
MIAMILFMKSVFTLFVATIVWVYWKYYGPQNFLWMSDIGLFLTLGAVWLESPLLISICICAFLAVELAWNLDFFVELITRRSMFGLAHYMFQPRHTLFLRSLSLFHVILPAIWLWLTISWGYDVHALAYAVPLLWIIFITTYFCTDHELNINWVFMPLLFHWKHVPMGMWFIFLLIGYPLLVCLPTHLIFARLF